MKRILANLQNKSEGTKHAIMWACISLIMTGIFGFWLLTFSQQMSQTSEDEPALLVKKELPSVLSSLKSQADLIFETLKNIGLPAGRQGK